MTLDEVIKAFQENNIIDNDITIEQVKSDVIDRTYDVYCVRDANKTVVFKRLVRRNEIIMNDYIKQLDFVPKALFSNESWLCSEYVTPNHEMSIEKLVKLVEKLHFLHWEYTSSKEYENITNELKQWRKYDYDALCGFVDEDIDDALVNKIVWAENLLDDLDKTIIHGDMIILNTIMTEDDVKIIDWEHGQYGPYIMDISRLLGDFNVDKKWINPNWEKTLVTAYYELMSNCKTYSDFLLEYECGKMHNYLGIVDAYKSRNLNRDKWYDLNLSELKKSIEKINELRGQ